MQEQLGAYSWIVVSGCVDWLKSWAKDHASAYNINPIHEQLIDHPFNCRPLFGEIDDPPIVEE